MPGRAAFWQAYQMGAGAARRILRAKCQGKPSKGCFMAPGRAAFGRCTRWVPGNRALGQPPHLSTKQLSLQGLSCSVANYVSLGGSDMVKESKLFIVLSCLVVVGLAAILIITLSKEDVFPARLSSVFVKASWFFIGIAVIMVIERRGIWKPVPDLALLAVVVLYGITVFWAKSKGAAIDGALKYCIYLGVFLSVGTLRSKE